MLDKKELKSIQKRILETLDDEMKTPDTNPALIDSLSRLLQIVAEIDKRFYPTAKTIFRNLIDPTDYKEGEV